jgi:hypothetical protein
MNIQVKVEARRGCGYRVPGGLYLVTEGFGRVCGALPIELKTCPTCHQGIKPARSWTWINIAALVDQRGCKFSGDEEKFEGGGCGDCPIADAKIQTAGLLWVGEKFYSTPDEFSKEAQHMGISRRISMVPRGFRVGETWVALAHRKAYPTTYDLKPGEQIEWHAAIFHIFRPQRIEYVVKDDDSEEKLEGLEKRGITLVKVQREQEELKV